MRRRAAEGAKQAERIAELKDIINLEQLRAFRREVRSTPAELSEDVAEILENELEVYYPNGDPVLDENEEQLALTFAELLDKARDKYGINVFHFKHGPNGTRQEWNLYSNESQMGARKAAERNGDVVDLSHRNSWLIPLYSTVPGACEDAGGGEEEGGSVEKRLQDVARTLYPDKLVNGETYMVGVGKGPFSEADEAEIEKLKARFMLERKAKEKDALIDAKKIVRERKLTAEAGHVGLRIWF